MYFSSKYNLSSVITVLQIKIIERHVTHNVHIYN